MEFNLEILSIIYYIMTSRVFVIVKQAFYYIYLDDGL